MADMFDPTKQKRSWQDIQESCGIEDKNTIQTLASRSYEFFFKHVVGYNTTSPVTQKALEFHQNPEKFKKTDNSMDAIKSCVVAPRGHSKTVSWTIGPSLWRAYKEKGKGIIVSSASRTQSTDILEDIKRIIIRNDALNHLRPTPENIAELGENCDIDASENNWSATSITTTTDVSISTKSFGSSIRGKHVDYVFLDDVLQDEKSGSRSTSQEKDSFYNIITPIVENKDGLLTIVGTPMSHDDLLMELLDKDSFYSLHFQAYDSDKDEVLWSEKWSVEGLKQKKSEIGPARFAREYQTNPMSVEEQYFSVSNCIEPNRGHKHYKPKVSASEYKDWEYSLGVDVALSDSKGSDFNVFTVIGTPAEGDKRFVVDLVRQQTMSPADIAEQMQRLDNKYRFKNGLYEKNAQGEGLHHQVQDMPRLRNRIEGFDTTRKTRPQVLSGLQAALYRGELKLPDDDTLIKELSAFHKDKKGKLKGKGKDDHVLSLAIAYWCTEGRREGETGISIVDSGDGGADVASGVIGEGQSGGEENSGKDVSIGIV